MLDPNVVHWVMSGGGSFAPQKMGCGGLWYTEMGRSLQKLPVRLSEEWSPRINCPGCVEALRARWLAQGLEEYTVTVNLSLDDSTRAVIVNKTYGEANARALAAYLLSDPRVELYDNARLGALIVRTADLEAAHANGRD